jgi:hypothetical protein
MTRYLVCRGERYIQFSIDCVYQIHSVFESAVNPQLQPESFTADFLNYRKGVNQWTPENWSFNMKTLNLASPIDGERVPWVSVPVIEHCLRPCFYLFINKNDVLKLLK